MKSYRVLVLLLLGQFLLGGGANAQRHKNYLTFDKIMHNDDAKKFAWGDYGTLDKYRTVPERYKDEPAVFLLKERYESYKYKATPGADYATVQRRILKREVIKIQDKKVLEDYSTFYLRDFNKNRDDVGIRLIKSSGEFKEFGIKELMVESKGDYKLAVPNLEVGDIIDYYEFFSYNLMPYKGFNVYDASNIFFIDKYPIVYQRIEFVLKKKTFMIFSALNGAPEPNISIINEDQSVGLRRSIVFEDSLRDKMDIESRWMYPLLVYPNVRYQYAVGAGSFNLLREYFFDKEEKATTIRTDEEIVLMIRDREMPLKLGDLKTSKQIYNPALKFITGKKYDSPLAEVHEFYNYLRARGYIGSLGTYNYQVFKVLSYYFTAKKIKHDIVHYVPRSICNLDDMLARSDVHMALKIYLDGKEYYYGSPSVYSIFAEMPYAMQGVEAYSFNVYPPPIDDASPERIKIPTFSSSENVSLSKINLNIDGETLKVELRRIVTGSLKFDIQSKFGTGAIVQMENIPYLPTLQAYYDKSKLDYNLVYVEEEKMEKPKWKEKELMAKYNYNWANELLMDKLEKMIGDEFGEDAYDNLDSCRVHATGRSTDKPAFDMVTNFTLKDHVKKLGSDVMVNIGALISKQVDIDDADRTRNAGVYMDEAREFHNEIRLKIPTGFEVEGLEKLSVNVENEAGSFISTASVTDGVLLVSTKKVYKHLYEPKENWGLMLEFLDAAFDFTAQKVLLRKKG